MIKHFIKKILLKRKNIWIDNKSNINYGVLSRKDGKISRIIDSQIKMDKMGYGCFLEHVYGYGKIELGNYVSISGPGTILHSEVGKISIGSFSSIAANVSIQEFNHNTNRVTSKAIGYEVWNKESREDFLTKGNITIEEDVWIGSNVVILSGVTIGRGSVIGAGAIVTKDVPPYSILVGNPGKVLKKRFSEEKIVFLESLQWWTWEEEKIKENQEFFTCDVNEKTVEELKKIIK